MSSAVSKDFLPRLEKLQRAAAARDRMWWSANHRGRWVVLVVRHWSWRMVRKAGTLKVKGPWAHACAAEDKFSFLARLQSEDRQCLGAHNSVICVDLGADKTVDAKMLHERTAP